MESWEVFFVHSDFLKETLLRTFFGETSQNHHDRLVVNVMNL